MTSWLTELGAELGKTGGIGTTEQVYQLAIELAPNCPQPYAKLANLYQSARAYWKAAEYYHQAYLRTNDAKLAARYCFREGLLQLRYVGDMVRTVYCFQLAEKVTGWEANQWEKGAASYYLGEALEAAGNIPGAIAAYKRVLNCEQCGWHHASALGRLKVLESAGATQ